MSTSAHRRLTWSEVERRLLSRSQRRLLRSAAARRSAAASMRRVAGAPRPMGLSSVPQLSAIMVPSGAGPVAGRAAGTGADLR